MGRYINILLGPCWTDEPRPDELTSLQYPPRTLQAFGRIEGKVTVLVEMGRPKGRPLPPSPTATLRKLASSLSKAAYAYPPTLGSPSPPLWRRSSPRCSEPQRYSPTLRTSFAATSYNLWSIQAAIEGGLLAKLGGRWRWSEATYKRLVPPDPRLVQ
jgi:hypothetical protein